MEEKHKTDTNRPKDIDEKVVQLFNTYGGAGVDLGYLLCDQHVGSTNKVALIYKESADSETKYTFTELGEFSTKFASVLTDLGVRKGDRVATLLPKSPELLIAVLAIWRLGAVQLPLFTAFGEEAVDYRLRNSETSVLITDKKNRDKVKKTKDKSKPAHLSDIIVVEGVDDYKGPSGDIPFWESIEKAINNVQRVKITGDDPFILIYTSGTTGDPKGVEILAKLLASIEIYMRWGLDVRDEDVFWNMADPGWAYGLFYSVVGPLLIGQTTIFLNAPFDVGVAFNVLKKLKVTNLATSPTVFRVMRSSGIPNEVKDKLCLRVASCAGEPLNPEVLSWGQEHLGVSIHDQYGQTELGMVVANLQFPILQRPLKPGSAGHSMPGFKGVILDESGNELAYGNEGQLAIDTLNSPLFSFKGYYKDPEKTADRFKANGRYYLTGDSGSQDQEGYIFFTGRNDDVITSSGYRIGPYEIESILMSQEAVGETAVIGVSDKLRGEIVKAFVVLKAGFTPSESLAEEMRQIVKRKLSAHVYPREIEFVKELPKTPSGKIQRFLLRNH